MFGKTKKTNETGKQRQEAHEKDRLWQETFGLVQTTIYKPRKMGKVVAFPLCQRMTYGKNLHTAPHHEWVNKLRGLLYGAEWLNEAFDLDVFSLDSLRGPGERIPIREIPEVRGILAQVNGSGGPANGEDVR